MKFLFLVIFIFTVQIYGESKSESILHKLINNHPEVLSYRKTIRSKIAGSQHSDTYPDPKFGVSFKNYPYKGNPFQFESGKSESISMSGVEYMVSQEIPYPGKLGREREVRKLDTLEFSYITEEKINFFLAQLFNILVQLKFTEIKYTQAEAISKISNSIKRVSNAEYTIGNKSLSSSSYNHIDQVEAKELMIDLESKKNSLEANLNYFSIDNSITKEDLLNIKFENYLNSIFNELKNKKVSVENIPGFNIQRVVFEKSVKEMNLKEINHYPDTEIYFAYLKRNVSPYVVNDGTIATLTNNWSVMDRNDFQGDLFSVGATIRVPVWSLGKNKELQSQVKLKSEADKFELEKMKKFLESEIPGRIAIIDGLDKKIQIMGKEHIPLLKGSLSSSKANYGAGKGNFSNLSSIQLDLLKMKYKTEELKELKYMKILELSRLIGLLTKNITGQSYLQGGENEN